MQPEHDHLAATGVDRMPDGTLSPVVKTPPDIAMPEGTPVPDFHFDEDTASLPVHPSQRMGRLVIGGVAILMLVVLIGGLIAHARQAATVPLAYSYGQVTNGNLTVTASATGQVTAGIYNLSFSGAGKITTIAVKVGQNVTAGQMLAQIDPTSLQDALNSAQNSLNSAEINLSNAYTNEANSDALALDTYNQSVTAAKGNAQKLQQARDQYNQTAAQAQSQVSSAAQQVANAQTQLTTAQHNLAGATMTAPVTGQIAQINGLVGAAPSSSPVIVLVNLNALSINAQVNEANIGAVHPGQPIAFTVPAYPQATFYGMIATVSPIGQTTSNIVIFPVSITIDAASIKTQKLFINMTAQVTITTQQFIGVTLVPNAALTYARAAVRAGHITTAQTQAALQQAQQLVTSTTDASVKQGTASYVLETQNKQVVAIPVVIGTTDGTNTVIVAGLAPNDAVIIGDNQATTTTTSNSSSTIRNRGGSGGFLP